MRAYKTEVKLNKEQERLYKLNISASRIVWNLFIEKNEKSENFINDYAFSKWFNNEFIISTEKLSWLKQASSKHLKKTMSNCCSTYKKAFKKQCGFPKKKKPKNFNMGYYFVRNSLKNPIKVDRHKINIPCLGWVHIKEKGYIPLEGIVSGVIKERAGRYFLSVITEEDSVIIERPKEEGVGIDLGIKEFMTCSNGLTFNNINKSNKIKKLEKKLKREQRALSRKYEAHKKNKLLTWKNFEKNKVRIEKQNYKLECKRNDYINKCIEILIEQNPSFVTLEDLNIHGMRKNKHLAKAISDSKLYYTKQKVISKCSKNNIEVREVDRFYPSSKICSNCGSLKKDLKLSDRTYKCSCGLEIDRDINASINLKNCKQYKILNETTAGLVESNDCGQYKNLLVPSNREGILEEAVKSRFVFKQYLDTRRNIMYNKYVNILQI